MVFPGILHQVSVLPKYQSILGRCAEKDIVHCTFGFDMICLPNWTQLTLLINDYKVTLRNKGDVRNYNEYLSTVYIAGSARIRGRYWRRLARNSCAN